MIYGETLSDPEQRASGGVCTTPRILNRITATFLSFGTRNDRTVYLRSDDGALLELESAITAMPRRPFLVPGLRVLLAVPDVDVKIVAPRPHDPYGVNEWAGRVVLSKYQDGEIVVTVKILGQPLTFTSTNVSDWVHRPVRTWDQVRISIEPAAVSIVSLETALCRDDDPSGRQGLQPR